MVYTANSVKLELSLLVCKKWIISTSISKTVNNEKMSNILMKKYHKLMYNISELFIEPDIFLKE